MLLAIGLLAPLLTLRPFLASSSSGLLTCSWLDLTLKTGNHVHFQVLQLRLHLLVYRLFLVPVHNLLELLLLKRLDGRDDYVVGADAVSRRWVGLLKVDWGLFNEIFLLGSQSVDEHRALHQPRTLLHLCMLAFFWRRSLEHLSVKAFAALDLLTLAVGFAEL